MILERELRYCADVPINGPIYGDENLAERCVWIPYVEAHTSCDQMERAPEKHLCECVFVCVCVCAFESARSTSGVASCGLRPEC